MIFLIILIIAIVLVLGYFAYRISINTKEKQERKLRRENFEREIQNRINNAENVIMDFYNGPIVESMMRVINECSNIQSISISEHQFVTVDENGQKIHRLEQFGIKKINPPEKWEVQNRIDKPYLLACALNRKMGNKYSIVVHDSYYDYYSWFAVHLEVEMTTL